MRFPQGRIGTEFFPPASHDHFTELDGMRGVLAIAVMLFHYGLSTMIARISLGALPGSNWGLCVDFFFLLSGFVLCRSFIRRPVGTGEFLWRRTLRLVPMYLVATVLSLLFVQDKFSNVTIATNLVLLQPAFAAPSINFAAWSVPLELWIPLIAVGTAPFLATMNRTFATGALAATIILGSLICYIFERGIDLPWARAGLGLSCGALLYYWRVHRIRTQTSALMALFGVLGGILIMMVSGVLPLLSLLFYPCSIAAIWFGADSKGLFSTRPFQAAGRWSYSIYLLHVPVLAVGQLWAGSTLQGAVLFKAGLVISVIALAALTYRVIEKPAMKLRLWRAPAFARTS